VDLKLNSDLEAEINAVRAFQVTIYLLIIGLETVKGALEWNGEAYIYKGPSTTDPDFSFRLAQSVHIMRTWEGDMEDVSLELTRHLVQLKEAITVGPNCIGMQKLTALANAIDKKLLTSGERTTLYRLLSFLHQVENARLVFQY
jgi:hypothetical protein